MELHAIQLLNVTVEELHIKVVDQNFSSDEYPRDFSLVAGRSEYNADEKVISIRLAMEINSVINSEGKYDRPFELKVSIAGQFEVDESKFPVDKINDWAEKNAPVILIPYIREHAYSMTVRAGVEPVLFPLIQVPTIKISSKE